MGKTRETKIKFCIQCGSPLQYTEKIGRERPNCPACGWTFFPDPKVAVAVMVENDEHELLLVQRIHTPMRGYWTLPVGYMDAGEDPVLAAERECLEETGLKIHVSQLVDIIAVREHPNGANLLIIYCGEILGGSLEAGDDAGQAEFFPRDQLPPLAFASTRKLISQHFC